MCYMKSERITKVVAIRLELHLNCSPKFHVNLSNNCLDVNLVMELQEKSGDRQNQDWLFGNHENCLSMDLCLCLCSQHVIGQGEYRKTIYRNRGFI